MKSLILLLAVLAASPAFAVTVNPYTYQVDGQLSMFGNEVCTPSPCTETLTFSFRFDWAPAFGPGEAPLYYGEVVPGSSSVISFGPLSPFEMAEGPLTNFVEYLPFGNGGDEIDVTAAAAFATQTPWVAPGFDSPLLYACGTPSCLTDFMPPEGHDTFGVPSSFQETVTAVSAGQPIPEPSMLLFLVAALVVSWIGQQVVVDQKKGR